MAEDISTLVLKVKSDGIKDGTKQLNDLSKAADKAEQSVKKLGTQVITSTAGMTGSAGATVALTNALLLLNTSISTLTVNQVNNTRVTQTNTNAMRDAHDAARGLAGSLGALWVTYGNMIPLAAGLAVGTAVKGVLSVGVDVEHAIESMRVKGDESVESANKLREAIYSIGQGVYGPREVAGAFDTLILAGLDAKQAMDAVKASLNLATAGGSTIEKAATALVTIGTAVGATAKEYDMLADGITKAANTSLASVDSIAEAVKRASVVNKLYGATFEDILVQAAALSQLGIKNTAAGTAITNSYGDMTGKTKKARDALNELGMSFFDATGKARPLLEAMEEYDKRLKKFSGAKQLSIDNDIFGERGLRNGVALIDLVRTAAKDSATYKNRLEEITAEIKNMAGTASLASAQLALTTENQLKSVKNTLDVTFAKVFRDMEPQINVVAMRLKQAFGSDDFKQGVTALANAVATLTVALVENVSWIMAVVTGLLAFKTITAGGALFAGLIPVVNGLAVAMGAVTTTTAGATVATGAFGRAILMLPGIGLVLGGIAAIAGLLYFNMGKVKDAAQETATAYNTNYLQALTEEADRLKKTNELMKGGVELRDAETRAMKEQALAKAQANNQDAIASAAKTYAAAIESSKAAKSGVLFTKDGLTPSTQAATVQEANALAALNEAKRQSNEFDDKAGKLAGVIISESEKKRVGYLAEQKLREEKLKSESGTNNGAAKPDPAAEAYLSYLEGERLELTRLRDSYKARTAALVEGADIGMRVMADVEQARVRANEKEDKYANDATYRSQLKLAAEVDAAKFDQQKANALTEQSNKLTAIINAEAAYQAQVATGSRARIGALEKETVAIGKFNGLSDKALETERKRAVVADEDVRIAAARTKLQTSTGSSEVRGGSLADEADAMLKYGKGAKQTALELAELEIEKLKLKGTGSDLIIQQRLEAAGLEDIQQSYNDLAKMISSGAEREALNTVQGLDGVIGAETAKVAAHAEATQAIIKSNELRAWSGLKAAIAGGDPDTIKKAQAAYDEQTKAAEKASAILQKHLTVDFKVAGLKDVSTMIGSLGKAASGLSGIFTRATNALEGMASAFTDLADVEAKEGIDEQERMQGKIGAYGNMASAAAGFFSEGSKGYNTMMGVSKIFHTAEMAMGLVRMGQKAVEAVLNQAGGDPYTAFARMAAMAALVATLGFAVGGGFNSDKGGKSAAEVQKTQGTGSVFGDSEAKSDSIGKGIEALEKNSSLMLPLTSGMLKALQAIQASIAGLSNLVLRTDGVTDGSNMNIPTGVMAVGNGITSAVTKLTSLGVGGWTTSLSNGLAKLFGSTTKKVIDAGLQFGGKVSDLQSGNGFNQYASVDTTKKSFFGLVKKTSNSVETQGLNDELSKQFGLVFTNLETTLKLAATSLGKSGDDVGKTIDNLVIETSKVSLMGLKGDELTAAINSVISKTMDQIAEAAFPAMGDFRQVGEGYAQTVIRVASGIEQAQVALKGLGVTAVDYTAIVNKQGDVATEIIRQSIVMKEASSGVGKIIDGMAGAAEDLTTMYKSLLDIRDQMKGTGLGTNLNINQITGAGGVAELGKALSTYSDKFFTEAERTAASTNKLTESFAALGKPLPATNEDLRAMIEAANALGTAAGDELVGKLLILAGGFADLTSAMDKVTEKRTELLTTIATMEKNDVALRELTLAARSKELKSLDASLRPLQERVYILEDELAATEALKVISDKRTELLTTIATYEKNDVALRAITLAAREKELKALDASLRPLQERVYAIEDETAAIEDETAAIAKLTTQADTMLASLSKAISKEKEELNKAYDAQVIAINAKAEADKAAATAAKELASTHLASIKKVFDSITAALASTSVESEALNKSRRKEAQNLLQTAAAYAQGGGSLVGYSGLDDALKDVAKPSESFYSTFEDYASDQAKTAATLLSLQANASGQVDYAQLTVDRLDDTISAIDKATKEQLAALKTAHDEDLKRLDDMLSIAQQQLDQLKGLSVAVLSLKDALAGFAASATALAIANATKAQTIATPSGAASGTTAAIASLYKDLLGRDPDAEGLKFWQDYANSGKSISDVASGIEMSDEYKNLHKFDVGTNYVPEDMPAMVHKGERIIPAADNVALMNRLKGEESNSEGKSTSDITELKAALDELKAAIMAGDLANVQINKETMKILRKWDNDGQPPVRSV